MKPLTKLFLAGIMGLCAIGPSSAQDRVDYANYKIKAGDELFIKVWRRKDLTELVRVDPQGGVTLPLLGTVPARGLTTNELAHWCELSYSPRIAGETHIVISITHIESGPKF